MTGNSPARAIPRDGRGEFDERPDRKDVRSNDSVTDHVGEEGSVPQPSQAESNTDITSIRNWIKKPQ